MSDKRDINPDNARQAVAVLSKILASSESIKDVVKKAGAAAEKFSKPETHQRRTVQFIIMHYSNLCAIGGGVSALPGIIPGLGTLMSIFGVSFLDALVALKCELEMVLALSHFAGIDIDSPKEKKIALLLACSSLEQAYDSHAEPSFKDVTDIAMSEYSTRELSITMLKTLARVIVQFGSKNWAKAFPFIGIAISASVNKVMTSHMGRASWKMIKKRADSLKAKP